MVLSRLLGAGGSRPLRDLQRALARMAPERAHVRSLGDEGLRDVASRLRSDASRGRARAEIEPLMLACAAESAARHLGQDPRPAQLLCAIAMCRGLVAELPTGEGKTLAAALAASACAVGGEGVHVMTVNDFLAARDAAWMAPVFRSLALTVAGVGARTAPADRRTAYKADVTYATAKQIGFDVLRDDVAGSHADRRHRGFSAALLDEVDSLLVDEGRVPLVLSGQAGSPGDGPYRIAEVVEGLVHARDFEVDAPGGMVWLTEAGVERVEAGLGQSLYEGSSSRDDLRGVNHALRARALYRRDRDYVVRLGQVLIVDEYTGRLALGRRWAEGLHQAIEAKERLPLSPMRTTHARMTMRALVSSYQRVGGMTATGMEVGRELERHYGLRVVVLPPHVPSRRVDHPDRVLATVESKLEAAVQEAARRHRAGQPLLVGCGTVRAADEISARLTDLGVAHTVLTARDDEREAEVIAAAGRPGSVTVATHLAGRGVDIRLGGPGPDRESARRAADAGGLCVIGTERYESTRIERQLRGRAGRQGEAGESLFFVSPDDAVIAGWGPVGGRQTPAERMRIAQINLRARNDALRADLLAFDEVFERHRLWARGLRDRLLVESPDEVPAFDRRWVDHLAALDDALDSIHLRAVAAESPVAAWHKVAKDMLDQLFDEPGTTEAPVPRQPDDRGQRYWLTRLGPRAIEDDLDLTHRARSSAPVSAFQAMLGMGALLDVVAVCDVDGAGR